MPIVKSSNFKNSLLDGEKLGREDLSPIADQVKAYENWLNHDVKNMRGLNFGLSQGKLIELLQPMIGNDLAYLHVLNELNEELNWLDTVRLDKGEEHLQVTRLGMCLKVFKEYLAPKKYPTHNFFIHILIQFHTLLNKIMGRATEESSRVVSPVSSNGSVATFPHAVEPAVQPTRRRGWQQYMHLDEHYSDDIGFFERNDTQPTLVSSTGVKCLRIESGPSLRRGAPEGASREDCSDIELCMEKLDTSRLPEREYIESIRSICKSNIIFIHTILEDAICEIDHGSSRFMHS